MGRGRVQGWGRGGKMKEGGCEGRGGGEGNGRGGESQCLSGYLGLTASAL